MSTLRIDPRTKKRLLQYKLDQSAKEGRELNYSEVISLLLYQAEEKSST